MIRILAAIVIVALIGNAANAAALSDKKIAEHVVTMQNLLADLKLQIPLWTTAAQVTESKELRTVYLAFGHRMSWIRQKATSIIMLGKVHHAMEKDNAKGRAMAVTFIGAELLYTVVAINKLKDLSTKGQKNTGISDWANKALQKLDKTLMKTGFVVPSKPSAKGKA